MPLYTYKCSSKECNNVFEEFNTMPERATARCPICNSDALQHISAPAVHIFQASWWPDIASEPIYIESKRELKAACEKHDCIATGEM